MTQEFLGLRMRNFQGIAFIWTRTYSEIFKSELVTFNELSNDRYKNTESWIDIAICFVSPVWKGRTTGRSLRFINVKKVKG